MSEPWTTRVNRGRFAMTPGVESRTEHTNGSFAHSMRVAHNPHPDAEMSHQVSLWQPGQKFAIFEVRRGDAIVRGVPPTGSGFSKVVQPPSESLRVLIEHHHEHPDQWPVLLDALQEEYPHLWDAIEAHRAARRDSAAEQYARAFTAATR